MFDRYYSGVLLVSREDRFVLQRRDSKKGITNPGLLSTFGGQREKHEDARDAALRELAEELELHLERRDLTCIGVVEMPVGAETSECSMFVAHNVTAPALVLHEGAGIEVLSYEDCVGAWDELTPLCRTTIDLYRSRDSQKRDQL